MTARINRFADLVGSINSGELEHDLTLAMRDLDAMRREAIQVAAMAIRFARDICDGARGRA